MANRRQIIDASTSFGTTAVQVLAYNQGREYLYLENVGPVIIYINTTGDIAVASGTAAASPSLGSSLLSLGVAMKWETTVPTNPISAVGSAAGALLTVKHTVTP